MPAAGHYCDSRRTRKRLALELPLGSTAHPIHSAPESSSRLLRGLLAMILSLEQQFFTTCTRLFLQVLGNPAQRLLAGPGAQVPALHLGGPGEH